MKKSHDESITIHNWGVDPTSLSYGMTETLKRTAHRINPGHAAMTIRIPFNEENQKLLYNNMVSMDVDHLSWVNFKLKRDENNNLFYEIYWSFWPLSRNNESFLSNIKRDRELEMEKIDNSPQLSRLPKDLKEYFLKPKDQGFIPGSAAVDMDNFYKLDSTHKEYLKNKLKKYSLQRQLKDLKILKGYLKEGALIPSKNFKNLLKNLNDGHTLDGSLVKILADNYNTPLNEEEKNLLQNFCANKKIKLTSDIYQNTIETTNFIINKQFTYEKKDTEESLGFLKHEIKMMKMELKNCQGDQNKWQQQIAAIMQKEKEYAASIEKINESKSATTYPLYKLKSEMISRGAESQDVTFPISNFNIENMIKKAHELMQEPFMMYKSNCSTSSLKILHAGAPEELKILFTPTNTTETDSTGGKIVNNPQIVYSAATIAKKYLAGEAKAIELVNSINKQLTSVFERYRGWYYNNLNALIHNLHIRNFEYIKKNIFNLLPVLTTAFFDIANRLTVNYGTTFKMESHGSKSVFLKNLSEMEKLLSAINNNKGLLIIGNRDPEECINQFANLLMDDQTNIPLIDDKSLSTINNYISNDKGDPRLKKIYLEAINERGARLNEAYDILLSKKPKDRVTELNQRLMNKPTALSDAVANLNKIIKK